MLTRLLPAVTLSIVASAAAAQLPAVTLRQPGVGRPAAIMRAALGGAHRVIVPSGRRATLLRDSVVDRTVIVLGVGANVASTVHGSVIVVGGDLFLHPGAKIDGDAVAIGGGVYNSTLASVHGSMLPFPDVTYDITPTPDGYALDYRVVNAPTPVELIMLPLAFGVRIPEYNRVDGLVLPWGPRINLDSGRITIDPLVVYRTDLGELDPSVTARARVGPHWWADAVGERATLSNDRWIYSNLLNSVASLVRGRDYRNYYRAERFVARVGHLAENANAVLNVWAGGQTEAAHSVTAGGPWSLLHPKDVEDGMRRANPPVLRGRISSALAGVESDWTMQQGVELRTDVTIEVPFDQPTGSDFSQQWTLDAGVTFPTFGTQTFELQTHDVFTGGHAPPQRFAYLGGSGSIPTLGVLALGGDRLVFFDSRYNVPVARLTLPVVGPPVVTLRYLLGSAGVATLPKFTQNVGLRLTLPPARLEFLIDPATRKHKFNFGLTLGR